MSLFNKKKRIQYLGFDDFWYSTIGIVIISFVTNFLFNSSAERNTLDLIFIGWIVSLFFTTLDWLIIRSVLIFLRQKFPDFKDDKKRIGILIFVIIFTIIAIDFIGGQLTAGIVRMFGYYSSHTVQLKVLIPIIIIAIMFMAISEAIYLYLRLKTSIRKEEQAKQINDSGTIGYA